MTSSAPSPSRLPSAIDEPDLDRVAGPLLGVVVIASALIVYHLTRGSSYSADDWAWIIGRRGGGASAFVAPYNGHLSLVPIAIYRLMFTLVGIASFTPYRILLIVIGALVGLVFFEYARHRVGAFGALIVAGLLLFVGSGWNDILQPFQIAWLIAVGAGVLALSLLDRRRTQTDLLACLLGFVALASTSVGVAFAVGMAVDIALSRRRWRDAWIAGIPILLYVIWDLHYHPDQISLSALTQLPINLVQLPAAGIAGLVGLSGVSPTNVTALSLTFGVALYGLAAAVLARRVAPGGDWSRCAALLATLVVFTVMVTLVRSFQSPLESRYTYVVCVLVALITVDLLRGVRASNPALLGLAALAVVAVVSDIAVLRDGGTYFRLAGAQTRATLGAVDLDRGQVAAGTPLTQLPLYPLSVVTAAQYFAGAHALGSPADTLAGLRRTTPGAQASADAQLISDGDVTLAAAGRPPDPRTGPAPAVISTSAGVATSAGGCVRFTPTATLAPGASSEVTLRLAGGRASIQVGDSATSLAVRRFAPTFSGLGTVSPGGAAALSVRGDRAPEPWDLRLTGQAPLRVCTLDGA